MRVSRETQRRFVLGMQGLWPGRRWKGLEGAREAIMACRLVRVDPVRIGMGFSTLRIISYPQIETGLLRLEMSGDATIVIVVARTKQKLKAAGAISEKTAKTPKELGLKERWLKTSASAGVVATKDGRYYLTGKKKQR